MPSPDNIRAYHASLETDLGSNVYLRLASEWFDDSLKSSGHEGFRHVLSLRCYPVRNFKFQTDIQRFDPSAGSASYGLMADAYVYY